MEVSSQLATYTVGVSRLLIGFIGQCHISGYAGVEADAAFPQVCRRALQSARPGHHVDLLLLPCHHPGELSAAVDEVLRRGPRVVVIEVVGWLALAGGASLDLSHLPRGVRSVVQRVRHFKRASREIAAKTSESGVIHRVQTTALSLAGGLLRPLLPRLPRFTVAEYEACVDDALKRIKASGASTVVQGPAAGNIAAISKRLPTDAVERYRAVYEMARRVADTNGALFVDRWDTVSTGFFIPGTTRPTTEGQSVWGHLLSDQLLRAGLI